MKRAIVALARRLAAAVQDGDLFAQHPADEARTWQGLGAPKQHLGCPGQ
jgi:hypothetical protein